MERGTPLAPPFVRLRVNEVGWRTGPPLYELYTISMSHSQSFTALVLKTYDVGEADRLCVLFTRERGRVMARASGARRIGSRLGGSLLAFQHLRVELKEGKAGWIVAGVSMERERPASGTIERFMALEEGIELLLRLVTDEGPLPEVFDATMKFFDACADGVKHASLGYGFAVLHHLGFLPEEEEMQSLQSLNAASHAYLDACRAGNFRSPEAGCETDRLYALQSLLLEEHMQAPLRARGVSEAMG